KGGSYFPVNILRELKLRAEDENETPEGGEEKRLAGGRDRCNAVDRGDHETLALEIADKSWTLTPRQAAVLECICHGDSNKLIARRLSVSETTVKLHVRQIMRKL